MRHWLCCNKYMLVDQMIVQIKEQKFIQAHVFLSNLMVLLLFSLRQLSLKLLEK